MILAFETSGRPGRVALANGDDVTEHVLEGDAPELQDGVRTVLGSKLSQVTGYAISIGPGSFTGLRVGVSFLKGLAFVHPRPVAAVSSLEVLAQGLLLEREIDARILAVVDARRGFVFGALYRVTDERRLVADEMLIEGRHRIEDVDRVARTLRAVIAVGDGVPMIDARSLTTTAPPSLWTGRATVVARLGASHLAAGLGVEASTLEPVYHQVSGAEEKLGSPPS